MYFKIDLLLMLSQKALEVVSKLQIALKDKARVYEKAQYTR